MNKNINMVIGGIIFALITSALFNIFGTDIALYLAKNKAESLTPVIVNNLTETTDLAKEKAVKMALPLIDKQAEILVHAQKAMADSKEAAMKKREAVRAKMASTLSTRIKSKVIDISKEKNQPPIDCTEETKNDSINENNASDKEQSLTGSALSSMSKCAKKAP